MAARAVGVTDPRVLEAIRCTPRAAFVADAYVTRAYDDAPSPSHRQVTTQPSLSAAIIAALGLTGAEEVFEVGTGYGYQTALLAPLAARVISIDVWPDLAQQARLGPGGGEDVVLYQKGPDGLRQVRIVTAASFVRLHGRHGFPCQSRDSNVPDAEPVVAKGPEARPTEHGRSAPGVVHLCQLEGQPAGPIRP